MSEHPLVERLYTIAQRLDELADDLPELADIGNDLGKVAASVERVVENPPEPRRSEAREMFERALERVAVEIVADRYGNRTAGNPHVTLYLPPSNLSQFTKIAGVNPA